jgi:hypothetical protein
MAPGLGGSQRGTNRIKPRIPNSQPPGVTLKVTKLIAALSALPLALGIAATSAQARIANSTVVPLIQAGDPNGVPPDSPANRVDPNIPASPFSGVVSINIRYANGDSFICSGALVSKRHVVSAGHCIDSNDNGVKIDITAPGNDVRVVFNSQPNPGDPGRAIITANHVSMHANYQGFGNCPVGVPGFCVNDDIAVITMNTDAPDTAKIYRAYTGPVTTGQLITMVGYGTSGDGVSGYYVGPNFRIKRSGGNYMDLFDLDDEQNFVAGPQEVWYSDFDGNGQDTFCDLFGVCTPILANDVESALGGGDSGGPSFILSNGEYLLVGNNTFGGRFQGQVAGTFGTYFGGMVVGAYGDYLEDATGGLIQTVIPEPETYALMLAGLGVVGAVARRRKAK